MSTVSPTAGLGLAAFLKDEAFLTLGQPVLNLLLGLQNAKLDPIKGLASWASFLGELQPSLITFEVSVASQILSTIQVKLQEGMTAAQAALGQK